MPEERRRALARRYAERAQRAGAFVVRPDGQEVPIPVLLTPAVVSRAEMAQVSRAAHLVLSGLVRLTAPLMEEPAHDGLRRRLFGSFTPLETRGLTEAWRSAALLATARVDFLLDPSGQARALEVNTTIPAMQGYSDCVAEAFLREVAHARGLGDARAEALVGQNGRNTDDLLASLVAHLERLTRKTVEGPLTIAIVAREGDAQRGELEHYAKRWTALGHTAYLAAPQACVREGDRARVLGRTPDLIYRHVFARRLDPASEFAQMCLAPDRFRVLNPIASHLEVKGLLALLSAAAADGTLVALTDDERDAVSTSVPWTRVLDRGATSGPDGARIADLAEWTRAHAAELVLKRSWDYGGRSVFLGAEHASDAAQARMRALTGATGATAATGAAGATGDWSALVDFALRDQDAWVVQVLVPALPSPQIRVDAAFATERMLYTDLSAYTNTGPAPRPTGGAVRASESRIVNILGGGGLAPLLFDDVLEAIFAPS